MIRLFIYTMLTIFFSIQASSEEFCFRDSSEYEKYQDKMPEIFKKLPIVIGTQDEGGFIDIYVVLKIYFQNQTIVLNSDSWQGVGRYSDINEVERVCFDSSKKELVILFLNKKEFKASYTNHEIQVPGAVLKRISADQQEQISNKIKDKVSPSKKRAVVH